MTSRAVERIEDGLIAGSLAVFPLLPAGPTYLGRHWPWALELFLISALVAGLVLAAFHHRRTNGAATPSEGTRLIRRGYATWLIPVTAALVVGLLARVPFDAAFIRSEASGMLSRLGGPMDQATDALYPLRVWVTQIEGALAFLLLSSGLMRTSDPRRRVRLATAACLIAIMAVSAVAIVQYATRANLLEYWVRANPSLTRSHATLDDPNALASFLVLGIGLAAGIAWAASGPARGPRAAATIAALAGLAALVTTVSRAGWAALVIAAIVVAATIPDRLFSRPARARRLRLSARTALAIAAVAVLLWVAAIAVLPKRDTQALPATPWQAFVQTVDPRVSVDAVLKGRLLLWRAAVSLVSSNVTSGAGLGQFPRHYATYPQSAGPENAHNYFLQVLAEVGIAGLAALVVLLAAIALAIRAPLLDGRRGPGRLMVGFSTGVLAFVLTWVSGHPLLTVSNQLWFASTLAVALAMADLGTWDEERRP